MFKSGEMQQVSSTESPSAKLLGKEDISKIKSELTKIINDVKDSDTVSEIREQDKEDLRDVVKSLFTAKTGDLPDIISNSSNEVLAILSKTDTFTGLRETATRNAIIEYSEGVSDLGEDQLSTLLLVTENLGDLTSKGVIETGDGILEIDSLDSEVAEIIFKFYPEIKVTESSASLLDEITNHPGLNIDQKNTLEYLYNEFGESGFMNHIPENIMLILAQDESTGMESDKNSNGGGSENMSIEEQTIKAEEELSDIYSKLLDELRGKNDEFVGDLIRSGKREDLLKLSQVKRDIATAIEGAELASVGQDTDKVGAEYSDQQDLAESQRVLKYQDFDNVMVTLGTVLSSYSLESRTTEADYVKLIYDSLNKPNIKSEFDAKDNGYVLRKLISSV